MDGKEDFSTSVTRDEVFLIVQRTLSTDDFDLNKFIVKAASEHPMGFLGSHAKIFATVTTKSGVRELRYFVKKMPTAVPEHLEYAIKTRAFYKEIELYKTLFQDLKEAQKSKTTKWCPEYYYSRGEEMVVTEDLSAEGYYMLPERTLMDEEHIKASLKAMAAMHAGSFIFEEVLNRGEIGTRSPTFKKSDRESRVTLGEVYSHLTFETEASDEIGHPGNTFYEAGIRGQLNIVDLLPGLSQPRRESIKRQLPDILRKMLQLVKVSNKLVRESSGSEKTSTEPYASFRYRNVFLHGDLWANNLLFRKEKNGEVTALLVDFQLARYAPPAHDIVLFLHLVQTKEFRRKHERELLDFYYDNLSEELSRNGLSAEETLPKSLFLQSCDDYYDLGLFSSILYFQLILTPPEIMGKCLASPELYMKNMLVDRSEMIVESFTKDDTFKARMTEVMNDLIDRHKL